MNRIFLHKKGSISQCNFDTYDSMRDALNELDTLVGCASFSLNTLSMTEISVDVELMPTNALQSLTTQPAPSTSLPRFTVPAYEIHVCLLEIDENSNGNVCIQHLPQVELVIMTIIRLDLVLMFAGARCHLDC